MIHLIFRLLGFAINIFGFNILFVLSLIELKQFFIKIFAIVSKKFININIKVKPPPLNSHLKILKNTNSIFILNTGIFPIFISG